MMGWGLLRGREERLVCLGPCELREVVEALCWDAHGGLDYHAEESELD